jgi:type 1 glutamine amidotransferase
VRRRVVVGALAGAAALVSVGSSAGTPPAREAREPARVLVVTVVHGYRHEVIPVLEALIERLGRESGLYVVDRASTDEELEAKTTPEALEGYDAVIFANTSESVPVADREAFIDWVESGGGLVGIHGASTVDGWPEYTALLGGRFDYHKDQATVRVRVDDASHPATEGLESGFEVHEEMYLYRDFDRERVHMLLSLDHHPNTGEPGFFPWAWTRTPGQGRVFHTGAGHREDVVESEWFGRHLLGGIRWVLADGEAP